MYESMCTPLQIPASTRTKFESQWRMITQTGLGDLTDRTRFTCKGYTPNHQLIQDVDQLMTEKWESSEKSLWTMNQKLYTGASTVYKCSQKDQKKKGDKQSRLDEMVKRKLDKVTQARAVLSRLTDELLRRTHGTPPSRKQKRNMRILKLQGVTITQLKKKIAQQKALLQVKTYQLQRIKRRMVYRNKNKQYKVHSIASLKARRNLEGEVNLLSQRSSKSSGRV